MASSDSNNCTLQYSFDLCEAEIITMLTIPVMSHVELSTLYNLSGLAAVVPDTLVRCGAASLVVY